MAQKGIQVNLTGKFDYKEIISGIDKIKQNLSSIHIGEDISKNLKKSLEKIELDIPALKKLDGATELSQKEVDKYLKLLEKLSKEIKAFNNQLENTDFSGMSKIDITKIDTIDKKIKDAENKIKKAKQSLAEEFVATNFKNSKNKNINKIITDLFQVESSEIENKFKEIEDTTKQEYNKSIVRMEQFLSTAKAGDITGSNAKIINAFFGENSKAEVLKGQNSNLEQAIRNARNAVQKFGEGSNEAYEPVKKLVDLLNDPTVVRKDAKSSLFGENLATQQDINNLKEVKTHLGDIKTTLDEKKEVFSKDQADLIELVNDKTKATEEAIRGVKEAETETKKETKELTDRVDDYKNKLEENREEAEKMRKKQEALEATFGSLARRITSAVSAMAVFNKSMQIVRSAVRSVEELDAAFTQIAIVSERSSEEAWKMFDSFNKLAKQYSITTKDLTEGAKLFYQQGLSAADTMKMVEASTVSAALGEVTMTEAANTLTAAIQGYNESAAVAMDYTDKIAMVGAVSAADFNELSTAMEKTASSAYTAGIDFDHLLGMKNCSLIWKQIKNKCAKYWKIFRNLFDKINIRQSVGFMI